uniref:Uncharacterized protein n=1 Tax=Opuntia streptacantha TaxID=393608 RepID=A0A7C9D2Q5_OPUST
MAAIVRAVSVSTISIVRTASLPAIWAWGSPTVITSPVRGQIPSSSIGIVITSIIVSNCIFHSYNSIHKLAHIRCFQCPSGILLGFVLNECKISPDPYICYFPIRVKVPFQVLGPCINWIKIDDEQGFRRPLISCRFFPTTRPLTVSFLLGPLYPKAAPLPAKLYTVKFSDGILSIPLIFHIDKCKSRLHINPFNPPISFEKPFNLGLTCIIIQIPTEDSPHLGMLQIQGAFPSSLCYAGVTL